MAYHSAISSLALAALLILSIPGARAFDESRYPNWKGQWVERGVVRTSGWDSKLPTGAGEQVFLTPEYQAILAASVKADSVAGRQGAGSGRGINSTTLDVTFGGGVKAAGGMSNRIRVRQRQFASTPRRP